MVFRSWVSVVVVEMGAVCDRGGVEVAVVFARVVRLLGDARLVVGSMVMTVGTAGVDDPSWLCQHGRERRYCRVQHRPRAWQWPAAIVSFSAQL